MSDRFDDLSRLVAAGGLSRRQMLRRSGLLIGGTVLAAVLPGRTTLAASSAQPVDCRGKPDGDYSDPHNCNQYWTCHNGAGVGPRECPSGLEWWEDPNHPGKGRCEWPSQANCHKT